MMIFEDSDDKAITLRIVGDIGVIFWVKSGDKAREITVF